MYQCKRSFTGTNGKSYEKDKSYLEVELEGLELWEIEYYFKKKTK